MPLPRMFRFPVLLPRLRSCCMASIIRYFAEVLRTVFAFQIVGVLNVLRATGGAFRTNQVLARNHPNEDTVEINLATVCLCVGESYTVI